MLAILRNMLGGNRGGIQPSRAERIRELVQQRVNQLSNGAMDVKRNVNDAGRLLNGFVSSGTGVMGVAQKDIRPENLALRLVRSAIQGGDNNTHFIISVRDDAWVEIHSGEIHFNAQVPPGSADDFVSMGDFMQYVLDDLRAGGLPEPVYAASYISKLDGSLFSDSRDSYQP